MNQYMKEKCDKFSTKECEFRFEKLKSKDNLGRPRYVIKVVIPRKKPFNVFDSIYDNYDGNFCLGRSLPSKAISTNKSLINRLNKQPVSHDNVKIDGLEECYLEEIFTTISRYFSPSKTIMEVNIPLGTELSQKRKNAYKEKCNWTCEICNVDCSHLTQGYYFKRSYMIQYHHIDGDKYNNPDDDSNGKALCYTCHARQPNHSFMMNRNNAKYPGVDINRRLNTLRREQGISTKYDSHHGNDFYNVNKIKPYESYSLWSMLKIKFTQISNFFSMI